MRMTRAALTLGMSCSLALAPAGLAAAAPQQEGLVNVNISGVVIQAPISVAANLCDIAVAVLAKQVGSGDTECTATAESIATPGTGDGSGGAPRQDGLVNVNVSDVTVQLPISVAANVCDVPIAVLAQQVRTGDATCDAAATSEA